LEGIVFLTAQCVTEDGLEVALIGELEDERALRQEQLVHGAESRGDVGEMMEDTDHDGRIKGLWREGHSVDAAGNVQGAGGPM
jgi:hypothetical protein